MRKSPAILIALLSACGLGALLAGDLSLPTYHPQFEDDPWALQRRQSMAVASMADRLNGGTSGLPVVQNAAIRHTDTNADGVSFTTLVSIPTHQVRFLNPTGTTLYVRYNKDPDEMVPLPANGTATLRGVVNANECGVMGANGGATVRSYYILEW